MYLLNAMRASGKDVVFEHLNRGKLASFPAFPKSDKDR